MQVSDDFSIPAYLLRPEKSQYPGSAVMAIHGHGEVEPLVGLHDDYHHRMGLRLRKPATWCCARRCAGCGARERGTWGQCDLS